MLASLLPSGIEESQAQLSDNLTLVRWLFSLISQSTAHPPNKRRMGKSVPVLGQKCSIVRALRFIGTILEIVAASTIILRLILQLAGELVERAGPRLE